MAGSSITSIVSEQKCSVGRVGALARRLPCFTAEAPPGGVGVGGPRIALPPDEDDWLGFWSCARASSCAAITRASCSSWASSLAGSNVPGVGDVLRVGLGVCRAMTCGTDRAERLGGWVKCGEYGPCCTGNKEEVAVTLDPPIEVAPGETRRIYLHTNAYITFSPAAQSQAEVHGPLGQTPRWMPHCQSAPFKLPRTLWWVLSGGIGYSVGDAASAASAAATLATLAEPWAELPVLPHSSELLFAGRASELGGWIAQATDICAANRKAVDTGITAVDGERDAAFKIADAGAPRAGPAFQAAAPGRQGQRQREARCQHPARSSRPSSTPRSGSSPG